MLRNVLPRAGITATSAASPDPPRAARVAVATPSHLVFMCFREVRRGPLAPAGKSEGQIRDCFPSVRKGRERIRRETPQLQLT